MASMNVLSARVNPSLSGDRPTAAGLNEVNSSQAGDGFTTELGKWLTMLGLGGQNSGQVGPGVSDGDKSETKDGTAESLMSAMLGLFGPQLLGMNVNGLELNRDFPAGKEANSGNANWVAVASGSAETGQEGPSGWSLGFGAKAGELTQTGTGAERAGMKPFGQGESPALVSELDQDIIQTLLKELSGQIKAKAGVASEGQQQISDGTLLARNISHLDLNTLAGIQFQENGGAGPESNTGAVAEALTGEQNAKLQSPVGATLPALTLKHQTEGQQSSARDSKGSANGLNGESLQSQSVEMAAGVEADGKSRAGESIQGLERRQVVISTKNSDLNGSSSDVARLNPEAKPGDALLVPGSHRAGEEALGASYRESDSMKNNLAQEGQGHGLEATGSAMVGTQANDSLGQIAAGTKADSPSIWQQIASSLQEHMGSRTDTSLKRPMVKELEIQLHPAELGKIQIALRWDDGTVHLQVQASEWGTGTILQNHLSDLRQSLQDAGVACGMLQMSLNGERRQRSYPELFPEIPRRQKDENVAAVHYPQELNPPQGWSSPGMNGQRLNVTA